MSERARAGLFWVVICGRNDAADAAALVRWVARQAEVLGEETRWRYT
jgi:hypothetical protein